MEITLPISDTLNEWRRYYIDNVKKPHDKNVPFEKDAEATFECEVKGFLDEAYGKFGTSNLNSQIIMEYNEMFPFLTNYLPEK